jgi:hypothetical protein
MFVYLGVKNYLICLQVPVMILLNKLYVKKVTLPIMGKLTIIIL